MISVIEDKELKQTFSYSSWQDILSGASQSAARPLLFNLFLSDLFSIVTNADLASYTDDNTPYTSTKIPI